jgi:mitogen-activated protein kinase 1/3
MGKHRKSGKKVAIKQIKGVFDNETDCKRILREIKLLRRLDHPYIIKLYDIVEPTDFDNFNDLYLVLELADSDLKKVLKSGLFLTPVHIKTILYNLL